MKLHILTFSFVLLGFPTTILATPGVANSILSGEPKNTDSAAIYLTVLATRSTAVAYGNRLELPQTLYKKSTQQLELYKNEYYPRIYTLEGRKFMLGLNERLEKGSKHTIERALTRANERRPIITRVPSNPDKFCYFHDIHPSTPLRDLRLLGAHNAGANSGYLFGAQCQTLGIEGLLKQGVTVFDLRVSWVEGLGFAVYHNILPMPMTLIEILRIFNRWLMLHPMQFVIIILKDEETHTRLTPKQFAEKYEELLGENSDIAQWMVDADFHKPLSSYYGHILTIKRDFGPDYDKIRWQDTYSVGNLDIKKERITKGFWYALAADPNTYWGHYISVHHEPIPLAANTLNPWALDLLRTDEFLLLAGIFFLDFVTHEWAVSMKDWNLDNFPLVPRKVVEEYNLSLAAAQTLS